MGSAWRALVELALPPPLLLLALLLLPAPRAARASLLRVVDRVLTLPVLGTVHLAAAMQAATGAALLGAARDAVALGRAKPDGGAALSVSASTAHLARRWRAERNAWIATVAFLAWTLLVRVHVLVRRLAALEDAALERARPAAAAFLAGRGAAAEGGAAAAPPAARPLARESTASKKNE